MSTRKLKFRNYKPRSEELKREVLPAAPVPSAHVEAKLAADVPAIAAAPPAASGSGGAAAAAGAGSVAAPAVGSEAPGILMGGSAPGEEDAVNIAAKKPNWDLKREVQKKLDQLERQTQSALRELFRQEAAARQAAGDEGALAAAVGSVQPPEPMEDDVE